MFYYAQLNQENVCIGISSLAGEINQENMIRIDSMSDDYLFRKYEHGEWSEEKFVPDYGQVQLDRMDAVEKAILEISMILGGM